MADGDVMVTVAEVKEYLGVVTSDHDSMLTAIEVRTRAFIEQQTGRHFGSSTSFVEVLDGLRVGAPARSGEDLVLILRETPADDTLKVETRLAVDDSWEVLTDLTASPQVGAGYVEIDGREVWRIDGLTWPRGPRRIRASYDFGYASDGAQPEDIRQVAMDLIAVKYRQREIAGFKAYRSGDLAVTPADLAQIPQYEETLRAFRSVGAMVA